ncbi:MAG TPA: hypothetical protein VF806_07795 [Anaerolineaceae bacterium]
MQEPVRGCARAKHPAHLALQAEETAARGEVLGMENPALRCAF